MTWPSRPDGPDPARPGPNWLASPAHARWLEGEADALLHFAGAARTPLGFGYLGPDGQVTDPAVSELWITCRMTHVHALGALLGRPGCGPLTDHGIRSLRATFADDEHGGWYTRVGGPRAARKEAYPHAFVLLAAASATAAARPGAAALLENALEVSGARFWDEAEGLVVEGYDRAFATSEPYRGVNAVMHTVEAYLACADVTGDDLWLDRALRMVRRVVDGFARDGGWRIPEHFDARWRVQAEYNRENPAHPFRPYGATIGHGLEWSRLTLHTAAALAGRGREPEPWMLPSAQALFARAVADGWAVDGAEGFIYTTDFSGHPVVRERMHWVVAEAIAAAAALHRATGEEHYARWYRTWWEYAAEHLIEAPGRWVHELDQANAPSARTWPGKPDVYHALQATLVPRLPLAPTLAVALARGHLDADVPAPVGTNPRHTGPPGPETRRWAPAESSRGR